MVRLYHRDVVTADPGLTLRCLDAESGAGPSMVHRAADAEAFFRDEIASTMAVTEVLRAAGVNSYPPPGARACAQRRYTGALFPALDNVYDGFYISLGPGQALRLRGRPPTARFWSLVFYDRWFNTPDIAAHRCYLIDADVQLDADGGYEVVLSPDDPGHLNWIDTAGLTEGIFAIRCLLPQHRDLPSAEVFPLTR